VRLLANQDHAWVFLALIALAPLLAAWFYRRVPPTVHGGLRLTLAVLRTIALIVLFAALVEPVISLTSVRSERPVVAVLLDRSRSMSVQDGTGGETRGDEAVELLNGVLLERFARDAEVAGYAFADGVEEIEIDRSGIVSVPPLDGDATDIEEALNVVRRDLVDRSLGGVIIATDGAANRGGNLVDAGARLRVPVFVLGVGNSEPPVDIAVAEVRTNRISYAGESLPVVARITSGGFGGRDTTVELRENGALLDTKVVTLSGTGEESEVRFSVRPTEPGTHRYAVSVPQAAGEVVTGNNERIVVTTALPGKFRVLLAGGRPSWDFAFLRRVLENDRNIELTAAVGVAGRVPGDGDRGAGDAATAGDVTAVGRQGMPPGSRDELNAYDLVVLVDPDWSAPLVEPAWLLSFVSDRRGGLAVFGLPESAPEAWPGLLPVRQERPVGSARERRPTLSVEGEASPLLRVVSGRSENVLAWAGLPPVWTAPTGVFRTALEGRVLAEVEGEPVAVLGGRAGSGQVLVVLAEGVWRWKMDADDPAHFERFISNAARWLTARGEVERIVVSTDADVVPVGGRLTFTAQVYTPDLRPEPGASVEVEVARGGGAPVATLNLVPSGVAYEGELPAPTPGSYTYRATATANGEVVGSYEGTFEVELFALEDADIRRRSSTLRRLADVSGGAYVTPETLDELPDELSLERVDRRTTREYELWDTPWLLLTFVGLLSAEWTLRRRKGMP